MYGGKMGTEGQGSGGIRKVKLLLDGDNWEGVWEVGEQTHAVAFTWDGSYLRGLLNF